MTGAVFKRMKRILSALCAALCALACTGGHSASKPRYIWIDAPANFSFYANNEENIRADCGKIAGAGFSDIIVDVRPTNGDVLFRSSAARPLLRLARWTNGGLRYVERTADFDYLEAFIRYGHQAGLRVHAAVNTMVGGFHSKADGDMGMLYEMPERRVWSAVDNTSRGLVSQADDLEHEGGRFLDPANPQVQEFLLAMLGDLASYDGLDGIVLDRCRYDDYALDAGYTDAALERFTAYLGHAPERWPVFAEPGHIFLERTPDSLEVKWLTFRCKVIRDFVARAAATVHSKAPELQFGIYVGAWFSKYYRSGVNWTSPHYDIFSEPTYAGWVTPEYQEAGFADLVDIMFLGTYTGSLLVHGRTEKTMEGYARLGRERLDGDCPFAAGPDLGNEAGFRDGPQHAVIPDIVETMLSAADGLFVFDLCHVRMYDYWNDFNQIQPGAN